MGTTKFKGKIFSHLKRQKVISICKQRIILFQFNIICSSLVSRLLILNYLIDITEIVPKMMKKKFCYLLIIITTSFYTLESWSKRILNLQEYGELKTIVFEITNRFPPDQYHYIGIGRSPTPIIAFLQTLDKNSASNIPLSRFTYGRCQPKLCSSFTPKLNTHFKRYFPNLSKIESKKILMIDFVITGSSLLASYDYLKEYLNYNSLDYKLEILGITQKDYLNELILKSDDQLNTLLLSEQDERYLLDKLHDEFFDNYSEFGSYYIDRDLKEKPETSMRKRKPRLKYLSLLLELHDYISEDKNKIKEIWGDWFKENLMIRKIQKVLRKKFKLYSNRISIEDIDILVKYNGLQIKNIEEKLKYIFLKTTLNERRILFYDLLAVHRDWALDPIGENLMEFFIQNSDNLEFSIAETLLYNSIWKNHSKRDQWIQTLYENLSQWNKVKFFQQYLQ